MSRHEFIFDGEPVETTIEKAGDRFVAKVGEKTITLLPMGDGHFRVECNGRTTTVAAVFSRDTCYVDIESVLLELKEPSEDGFAGGAGDHAGAKDKIFAPMPGKIVKIMVAPGDTVQVKQAMVIVEAMKMENQVLSRANGVVKAVNFSAGDQVDTENPIIELELAEEK